MAHRRQAARPQAGPALSLAPGPADPPGDPTFCTRGDGSCQGTGINHNQRYLCSSLSDGSKTVVVQSSANLTTFELHHNLAISRNDKSLFDRHVAYWNALEARKENLDFDRAVHGSSSRSAPIRARAM